MDLVSTLVRSAFRIRLVFGGPLAPEAFTPGLYALRSLDDAGIAPVIRVVIAVFGTPAAAEIVLLERLAPGGRYAIHLAAVPGLDLTTVTADGEFFVPRPAQDPSVQTTRNDLLARFFGEDLQWDGTDFVEGPDGDVQTATGPDNAGGAVIRRILGEPLPWAAGFGGRSRQFVDGPASSMGRFAKSAEQQALEDDRVVSAQAIVQPGEPGEQLLTLNLVLVGGASVSVSRALKAANA